MRSTKKLIFGITFLFLIYGRITAQRVELPRSTPEAEGVSSNGIVEFINAVNASGHEIHSMMILMHGKVIAEGWWAPYRPDLKHSLYSLSKSFTSTAVGFAVHEKKLSVNDKVISFFPDKLPGTVSANLSEMTIRDLLTMSAGQEREPRDEVRVKSDDWVRAFLAYPVKNKPGTVFLYNSLATYMLSAIVQKVTGQKIIDYLTPRLFKPLGITGMDWETSPGGINTGGWGLRLKTEDIARFGQAYLQKGKWMGKQVIPEPWVTEATSFKIDNSAGASASRKESSDWMQGYCYQFWRCRHNAYRGDGAFGQYCIVLPDQDAVIAITSETKDMQGELNLVWQYLLPALQASPSDLDQRDAALLKQKLAGLKLPLPVAGERFKPAASLDGQVYNMNPNTDRIKKIGFSEKNKEITMMIDREEGSFSIRFGQGKWAEGTTTMLGPSLVADNRNHFEGLPPSVIAGTYAWKDPATLEMQLRYIDSPHTLYMNFQFSEDKLTLLLQDSFGPAENKRILNGVVR